jgi:hypothetical protein
VVACALLVTTIVFGGEFGDDLMALADFDLEGRGAGGSYQQWRRFLF